MKQFNEYILEKLKISKKLGGIRTTLEKFITWYLYDDDDWDESDLKTVEFARNTTESEFSGSYKKLYEFICKHRKDIIYVIEEKAYQDYYNYKFTVNDKEYGDINFDVLGLVESDSDLFSNANEYIVEKLKISKNNKRTGKLRDVIFDFFNIDAWVPKYFNGKFTDSRKKYFDDDVTEMVQYFCSNRGKMIEYEIKTIEQIDNTTELVELRFTLNDMEFSEQVIVEED